MTLLLRPGNRKSSLLFLLGSSNILAAYTEGADHSLIMITFLQPGYEKRKKPRGGKTLPKGFSDFWKGSDP